MVPNLPHAKDIMQHIDVLVDGKRVTALANLNLRFRGSSNQRVIDVQRTQKSGTIVRALGKLEQAKYVEVPLFTEKDIKLVEIYKQRQQQLAMQTVEK